MAIDERIAKNQSLTLDNKSVTTSEAIVQLSKQMNQLDKKLQKLEQDKHNTTPTSQQSEDYVNHAVTFSDKQRLVDLQEKIDKKEQELQNLKLQMSFGNGRIDEKKS
jgi:DNA-binding protein YbaB